MGCVGGKPKDKDLPSREKKVDEPTTVKQPIVPQHP